MTLTGATGELPAARSATAAAETAAAMEVGAMAAEGDTRPRGARHRRSAGIAARGAAAVNSGSLRNRQG